MALNPFPRRVGINVFFKLGSEVLGKLFTLVLMAVVARALGQAGFGIYVLGFTTGLILSQVTDFGMQVFVAREVAGNRRDLNRLVGNLLLSRVTLAVFGMGCLLVGIRFGGFGGEGRVAVCILAMGVLLNSFGEFIFYVFRGKQEIRFEAGLSILQRMLSLIFGLGAIFLGWGIVGVTSGFFGASAVSTGIAYLILTRRFLRPDFTIDRDLVRNAFREILPIGVAISLSAICFRVDVVILEALRGIEEVGLYGAGRRLMEPWALLPAALMAGVYPAFSSIQPGDPRRNSLVRKSVGLLLALGGVIACLGITFRQELINLVYGAEYAAAGSSLAFLMAALIPMFITYGLSHFMIALGMARYNAVFTGISLIVNVSMNLVLIPSMGAIGAALSLLAMETLLMILCAVALVYRRPTSARPRDPGMPELDDLAEIRKDVLRDRSC